MEETRYFQMPPSEIAYFGFVVHAYEGLAVVRTLDAGAGLVELLVAPDLEEELNALLEGISREIPLRELSPQDAERILSAEE